VLRNPRKIFVDEGRRLERRTARKPNEVGAAETIETFAVAQCRCAQPYELEIFQINHLDFYPRIGAEKTAVVFRPDFNERLGLLRPMRRAAIDDQEYRVRAPTIRRLRNS